MPPRRKSSPICRNISFQRSVSAMSPELINLIIQATGESLFMVAVAALVATSFGLPIGIFLATSGKGELFAAPRINAVLGVVVNATRSTPFIILVVAIIPFTRLIAGTSIGSGAAIVPLTIAATPFIARLVEAAIREVDAGLIETASSFGATPLQIVVKVLIPEALPGLLLALTLAVVSLLGYSAMVGAVGGGGLGDLGIRYGYQRFMPEMMLAVVVVLIALVQTVQTVGDYFAKRVNRRLRSRCRYREGQLFGSVRSHAACRCRRQATIARCRMHRGQASASSRKQLFAQGALTIGGLVDAARLQRRYHEIDEGVQRFRYDQAKQVETVDVGFLGPGDQFVGHVLG